VIAHKPGSNEKDDDTVPESKVNSTHVMMPVVLSFAVPDDMPGGVIHEYYRGDSRAVLDSHYIPSMR